MIRLALILLSLLAFSPTLAQVVPAPQGTAAMVCANNTVVPAPTNGKFFYVQCDASGKLITNAGGSATPSGPAGGDLSGTYPDPTVAKTGGVAFGPAATALAGQIPGTATNDNAAAGRVGELVESSGTPSALANLTIKSMASITLTAGDWDVQGVMRYDTSTSTTTDFTNAFITITQNGGSMGLSNGAAYMYPNAPAVAGQRIPQLATPLVRYSLTSPTVVYVNTYQAFAGGSGITGQGYIRARRVR